MRAWSKLAVRIPESLHRAAKAKAAEEGVLLEDVVAGFLRSWVEPERVERVEALLRAQENGGVRQQATQEAASEPPAEQPSAQPAEQPSSMPRPRKGGR